MSISLGFFIFINRKLHFPKLKNMHHNLNKFLAPVNISLCHNLNSCTPSWSTIFQFVTFLCLSLCESRCISCNSYVIYTFGLSVMFFSVHIFYFEIVLLLLQQMFSLSWCIRNWRDFSFVILECSLLFVMLDPVPVTFESSIPNIFWLISSCFTLGRGLFLIIFFMTYLYTYL